MDVQWNLSIMATIGESDSGLYREVALKQGVGKRSAVVDHELYFIHNIMTMIYTVI